MKRKPYVITENMKPQLVAEMIDRAYDEGYEDDKQYGHVQGLQEGQNNIDRPKTQTYSTTPGVIYCNGLSPEAHI